MAKPDAPTRGSRRKFLGQVASAVGTAVALPMKSEVAQKSRAPRANPFIGIQVGAVSFADEGVDTVLDILQQRAGVNALMLAVFTYGRGIAGRQIPGQPLPDHGAQSYDSDSFHGGSYTAVHAEYYRDSPFHEFRAPDLGDFDLLAAVVPKARARGMRSYCWFEDVYNPKALGNFDKVAEIDLEGRRTGQACLRNPLLRNFLRGLTEDFVKSHEVDGVMWGSERQGPLNNAIGGHHGGFNGHAAITCFCPYCLQAARKAGISEERARRGFAELQSFIDGMRAGKRPSDGAFVTFWRVLVDFPEILAWEKLWTEGQREVYAEIRGTVKAVDRRLEAGFHIWHNNSFSPFYRAEQDYERLAGTSDFLKVVMYNNCAGPRLAQYVRNVHTTIFGDLTPDQALEFDYAVLGYESEAPLERLPSAGLTSDYVRRETHRAVKGVEGKIPIYPGIDIDVPTEAGEKRTRPEDVRGAVGAALESGAAGFILSRKYSEMRLANLSAVGEALQALRVQ